MRPRPNRSVVINRVSEAETPKRSRRNKSAALFVSLEVRFELRLTKTIIVPYRDTSGCVESALPPPTRDLFTLINSIDWPDDKNTSSDRPESSFVTRLLA